MVSHFVSHQGRLSSLQIDNRDFSFDFTAIKGYHNKKGVSHDI